MSPNLTLTTTTSLVFLSLSLPLSLPWPFPPLLLLSPTPAFLLRVTIAISLHLLALWTLSIAAAADGDSNQPLQAETTAYEQQAQQKNGQRENSRSPIHDIRRQIGALAGIYTLILPLWSPPSYHPLVQGGINCISFFCACRVLDVAFVRAGSPPRLLVVQKGRDDANTLLEPHWKGNHVEYIFRLLTETRYASFDHSLKVDESKRRQLQLQQQTSSSSSSHYYIWTWLPRLTIPLLTFIHPIPELQILLTLVLIHIGLETMHTIFHPFCPNPLFHLPFAAPGIADFWAIHWHQGAQSWLTSLAYKPAKHFTVKLLESQKDKKKKKEMGSAVGILWTFALSGIWHGWSAAPMSHRPWQMGIGMFLVFLGQGVGCLVERSIWKTKDQGGLVKRIFCWAFAIECGAMFARWASPMLKEELVWMMGR